MSTQEEKHEAWTRSGWIKLGADHYRVGDDAERLALGRRVGELAFLTKTNLQHAHYLIAMADRRVCDICGDGAMNKGEERHELCRLRKAKGGSTPPIKAPVCPCMACQRERDKSDERIALAKLQAIAGPDAIDVCVGDRALVAAGLDDGERLDGYTRLRDRRTNRFRMTLAQADELATSLEGCPAHWGRTVADCEASETSAVRVAARRIRQAIEKAASQ